MRRHTLAFFLATFLACGAARAEESEPDGAAALITGAATVFVGFAVGGTLIGTGTGHPARTEAGWLTIESGFALAPLTSHAVVGEWARGAAFAAVPTATTLGSVPVFLANGGAVDHETLSAEHVMWGLFGLGMLAASVGVVDAAFAPGRAIRVAPVFAPGAAGITLGGTL